MTLSVDSANASTEIDSVIDAENATSSVPATAAVAATTAAATAAAPTTPTAAATAPTSAVTVSKSVSDLSPTIRIYIDTTDLPRPVIVNYRQLYKRELKKLQEREPANTTVPQTNSALDSADDLFYRELLKKAEAYNVDDDDVDDDGSDDENFGNESRKRGEDYDFDDPFIDDSDMLMDESIDHSAPEYDGFFVWHGPLDGHEFANAEKKQSSTASASKRKAPAKSKASSNTTTGNKKDSGSGVSGSAGAEKSRKKTVVSIEDNSDDKKKSSNNAATSSSSNASSSTASKVKKSSITPIASLSNNAVKKTNAAPDKASKKKPKLDHYPPTDESAPKSKANTPTASTTATAEGAAAQPSSSATAEKTKKKSGGVPATLKPLDPEIEVLMEKLRHDVKNENFNNKAKFPAALKPTVLEAGLITFRKHRFIDDNLVYHLMNILPYNKFTLRKFLTTKSGQMRVDELQQEIDELAIKLKQTIDRMMPEQQRLFNEKLAQSQASSETSNPEEEPTPKFKCNDEVRKILYDIIQTEEQSIHIANQVAIHKDAEKKNENLASDGKARKLMYQRLLSCWPEGWINSYEMSRQYSQYKSKVTAMSEKKNANSSLPSTPKANISTVDNKKRKRATPANAISGTNTSTGTANSSSSTSGEALRKKQSVDADIVHPPTSTVAAAAAEPQQQQPNMIPTNVITIDDDNGDVQPLWKQSNSMKIEALISGPSTEKKD
ncbi:hypothetical protein HMPREF1544_06550 [Mucor circinelloides 1006PhL]|uniref:Ubinuclein middle domain-containing protein n=1 Tax=Mucor circinelloides f. circinelloides (strain 1006PhL) TaxID=1220926 RepID=S2K375_MUCC1|nr:hypothetical protein HMPREF1544_06550 [Mucor circinelloides 1006PhL]